MSLYSRAESIDYRASIRADYSSLCAFREGEASSVTARRAVHTYNALSVFFEKYEIFRGVRDGISGVARARPNDGYKRLRGKREDTVGRLYLV